MLDHPSLSFFERKSLLRVTTPPVFFYALPPHCRFRDFIFKRTVIFDDFSSCTLNFYRKWLIRRRTMNLCTRVHLNIRFCTLNDNRCVTNRMNVIIFWAWLSNLLTNSLILLMDGMFAKDRRRECDNHRPIFIWSYIFLYLIIHKYF